MRLLLLFDMLRKVLLPRFETASPQIEKFAEKFHVMETQRVHSGG